MVKAVGVKFKHAGKVYYFDPAGKDVEVGDKVIVETAKGLEFATVVMGEEKIHPEKIVSPLKPVIRKATQEDIARNEENNSKKAEAMKLCQEKIDKHELEMKLVDVEYTFDNSKVIFYFTGEKIKTSDGILRVSEVDVLGNVIKARKIVKNIDAADEQLSDEVYTYEKEQVKRLGKKKGGKVKDEEMTEEMKELLKD